MLYSCTSFFLSYHTIILTWLVIRGSAVEITWNHWSTLVKDLEAIGEKNKQEREATLQSSTPGDTSTSTSTNDTQEKKKSSGEAAYHWERRPTWERATFCGIYVAGWAFSTAYLLKYRSTYVTGLRFFRGPIPSLSPTSSLPTTTTTTTTTTATTTKPKLKRFVHIQTASNKTGISIPLNKLSIHEGRNETELVIRTKEDPTISSSSKSFWKRKREYWFMSLTEAWVDGMKFGQVESARDRIFSVWDGNEEKGEGIKEMMNVGKRKGVWKSGPVVS